MSLVFTKVFRLLWILFFILLIFLDREQLLVKAGLISFLLLLTFITIGRTFQSRNEWREIVSEMEDQEDT